jgi:hypothetical protein
MDKSKVKNEAKDILDKFAKALGKVKSDGDFYIEREEFERIEGKECLLENAPNKDKDFILTEKGSWK